MHRNVVIALGVLALTGGAVAVLAQDRPAIPAADPSARARVDLACEAYRKLFRGSADRLIAPPDEKNRDFVDGALAEQLYRWSRRWMEARCDQDPAVLGTAIKEHRDRMRRLEEGEIHKESLRLAGQPVDDEEFSESLKALEDGKGEEPSSRLPDFLRSARFFRLEAESWLDRGGVPSPR